MSLGRRRLALENKHAINIGAAQTSASDFANGQVNSFLENVEDLTKALKDVDSPDIAKVRAKVKIALAAAKQRRGGYRLAAPGSGAASGQTHRQLSYATIPGK